MCACPAGLRLASSSSVVSQDDVKAHLNLTLPRKFRLFPLWRGKASMNLVAKNGSYDSNMCSSEEKAGAFPEVPGEALPGRRGGRGESER